MKNELQNKLQLFVNNTNAIRSDFIWHEPAAKRLAALVYTLEGREIDAAAIAGCHRLIKDEVSVWSSFRGNLVIYIAARLSLNERPAELLADVIGVYGMLRDAKFWASDFLAAAAFEIAENADKNDYSHVVNRTRAFFDEMKANHRFRLGWDACLYAAMMALSDLDPHHGANKLKRLNQQMDSEFSWFISRSSVLTLSKIMVLGGSTEQCVLNLVRLNRSLRNQKLKLDRTYTLPSLGVLGMLNVDHATLADDIAAARDFLRAQKGFGGFSVSTPELMLYAISTIIHAYAHGTEGDLIKASATSSVANLIIAQQVAIMAAVSVTATTAAVNAGAGY